MQDLTRLLLRCGATIGEINTVRKHLSLIQGGRLAQAGGGAGILSLLVSDVVGNPLDIIASGPTTADTSTYADALGVLRKYEISEQVPSGPLERLRRGAAGEIEETPKAGDRALGRVRHVIVADNDAAATAAARAAAAAGFDSKLVTTHMEGEAREVARLLAGIAKDLVIPKTSHRSAGLPGLWRRDDRNGVGKRQRRQESGNGPGRRDSLAGNTERRGAVPGNGRQ